MSRRQASRNRNRKRSVQALPQDEAAERAVVGCVLYGRDHEDLDPSLILNDGRRSLLIAAIHLRESGDDWPAAPSMHVGDQVNAAHARGERVIRAVLQSGTWPNADPPDWEIRQCLDCCSTIEADRIADHVQRLLVAWQRRHVLWVTDRLREAAHDTTSDLADALAAIDLSSLASGARPSAATSAVLTSLADITPVPIHWLWQGRIARGAVNVVAGQPGLGKSLLTVDLAARVSRGYEWPDGVAADPPADVILLSAEDDPANTIRPRLDAAGADVRRISLLGAVRRRDAETGECRERSLSLAHDLPAIADALSQRPQCRVIIIDPISAYLSGVDTHRNSDMRGLLAPLSRLAQERDVAVLVIAHLNKSGDSARPALDRVNGSGALCAAARSVWIVGRESDQSQRRIVVPAKNNLGPDTDGLAYTISITPEGLPVLTWDPEPIKTSADQLLAPAERDSDSCGPRLAEAIEWLKDALADGPVKAAELLRDAQHVGHSRNTLYRAKEALGVVSVSAASRRDYQWDLPAESVPSP